MLSILTLGFVCLAYALYRLPYDRIDLNLLILFGFSIGFGSRITIQIPRFKSHFSFSDTFIFLCLLLYGGEIAAVFAAVEAFISSWRFCNKKITVFFNAASMALSTFLVTAALKVFGYYSASQLHGQGENLDDFLIALVIMTLTHFLVNTGVASVYGAMKSAKPIWETWKNHYIWTFITYVFGAVTAGILLQMTNAIGFGVIIAAFPVTFFLYMTYKMYVQNVEMSIAQADQAKEYARAIEEQSNALRESEERFRSAFTYAPIGIALVSPSGSWLKVNRALSKMLEYTEEEFLASDYQLMIHPEDLGGTLVKTHELLSGKIPACQLERRFLSRRGKTIWTSLSISTTTDSKASQPNLIFQVQDITDKKIAEEKLQYEATHDALTGLPNRAFFMEKLRQALKKAREIPNHTVSVLFIDLDRFKIINDSLGHLIGDQLLIEIARRLRECLRPTDMVARLGGDEFTILVEGAQKPEELVSISQRIQEKFAVPFDLSGHEVYSSASIGILRATEKHTTPEDLMRDADTAMYQAKHAGRARYQVFDERMHSAVKETLQMETDLRRAIEKEELVSYYQPIFSLKTGEIEGFEALARWHHATLGVISPDKFIPLAEEIGLIDMLGEFILRRACQQMGVLQKDFPDKPLMLSVNLSCKQFAQPQLVQKIRRILEQTGFPARRLRIEITESVFFEHKEAAINMLNQLRELGIEINIDDFGTGYSNLSYLMRLPVSTLKIDRSFVAPLTTEDSNVEIVQTIVTLARSLGLRVIAEGVETEAQLDQLKKLNCEGAQGYFFAKPMSFDDAKAFIKEKTAVQAVNEFEQMPVLSAVQ